jgi:hypothetical protein
VSTHLLTRPAQRSPLSEVHEARHQRALVVSATLTALLSVTLAAVALVTVGFGA